MRELLGKEVTLSTSGKVVAVFTESNRIVLDIGGRWLEVHPDEIELVKESA
jgi:hypothetical protein